MRSSLLCPADCGGGGHLLTGSVDAVFFDSVTEFCPLTLPASTVLAADVWAACVQGA